MSIVFYERVIFEHYPILPSEIKMMIIDEMEPDDRCRFTRCSKQCYRQAKSSKKFIYGLELSYCSKNKIEIYIYHNNRDLPGSFGFKTEFSNESERKYMKYLKLYNKKLWSIELPYSTDLVQLALHCFYSTLQQYQNRIKMLQIDLLTISKELNVDFGITSLKSLERLHINDGIVQQIFSKLRKPLSILNIFTERDNITLDSYEQMYQVCDSIITSHIIVNYEQFLRLSAASIKIHIGKLTVDDILNFIKLWQNGRVRSNFKFCEWNLKHSNFNSQQLFNYFGVELDRNHRAFVRIEQFGTGDIAWLRSFGDLTIDFNKYTIQS